MGHNIEQKETQPVRLRLTRDLADRIEKCRATGMHAASTRTDFLLVLLQLGLEEMNRIEADRRESKRPERKLPEVANGA